MSNQSLKADIQGGHATHLDRAAPETERTIDAAWIEYAATTGVNVEIWNAVIHGPINLSGKELRGQLELRHCDVRDSVDFSGSVFHSGLVLSSTIFHGKVSLRNVTAKRDINLNRTSFQASANTFINMSVKGYLIAIGAHFLGAATFDDVTFGPDARFNRSVFARLSFNSVRVTGSLHFDRAHFQKQTNFIGLNIDGDLDFNDTVFEPANEAEFYVLCVGGDASFDRAVFGAKVFFSGSQIHGQGSFHGVAFEDGADFSDIKVDNDLIFRRDELSDRSSAFRLRPTGDPADAMRMAADFSDARINGNFDFYSVEVDGTATFVGISIGGGAIFRSARFSADSKTRFDLAHFRGGALFQGALFSGEADFRGVQIDLDARFSGADFQRAVSFEGSRFTGLTTFASGFFERTYAGTTFGHLSLKHARFEQDAHFDDAVIRGNADFRDAAFQVVYFSRTGTAQISGMTVRQFQQDIDLRGCTYKAMAGDWRSLLPRTQGVEYNRQPYTQLEKFFTNIGQPEVGDEVYLERRTAERKWKWRSRRYMAWFGDLGYFLFLRYGVRPFQLLVLALLLLVVGTLFFSQPHAVAAKDKKETAPAALSGRDAFELSLHQFLPVEIPLGEQWIPSNEGIYSKPGLWIRPSTFAALFLRLPGWILVPLGIASFTRLLRGTGGAKLGGGE